MRYQTLLILAFGNVLPQPFSYLHNVVSRDNGHPRVDTWQHGAAITGAAADVAELVGDLILGERWLR